jgi:HAD superfamily hydrolase (TIGR01509 family)
MLKAILFDMDGVLVDTEQAYYDRRKQFFESIGYSIDHIEPKVFVGGNMKHLWKEVLGNDYEKADIAKLDREYDSWKLSHTLRYEQLLFPHAKEVVLALSEMGLKLAICSSSPLSSINEMVINSGMTKQFNVLLSGSEFKETKPNPEIYLEAMRRLDVAPDECIVVEDSEKGIEAGVRSGAEVFAIKDTRFGMNQTKANVILNNLEEVLKKVSEIV